MKVYTIIGGVNGAGKSSLTGALKTQRTDLGKIIDVDKLTQKYQNKIQAGKEAIKTINDCIKKKISFTQETTLSGCKTLKTIKNASDNGFYIKLYYVGINSAEESILRIKNRVAKGGHSIPNCKVYRRYEHRFTDLCRVLPYCDEAILFDNENGFIHVAEYKNGELFFITVNPPKWVIQIKNCIT